VIGRNSVTWHAAQPHVAYSQRTRVLFSSAQPVHVATCE